MLGKLYSRVRTKLATHQDINVKARDLLSDATKCVIIFMPEDDRSQNNSDGNQQANRPTTFTSKLVS